MEIPFESWIRQQHPSVDAVACYEEAFLCYRTGAYRAALLFSYLGFMTYLRERISTSTVPNGLPAQLWMNIQAAVNRDDAWDATVFESTQRQNPVPIFVVTNELRQQVMYWKNRRNDCAHSKDNLIEACHVDGIWAFTKSNLNKFVVNGSRPALQLKISQHFNPALTPPGQSADRLVAEVGQAVIVAELSDFLNDLAQDFAASRTLDEVAADEVNRNQIRFLDRCLASTDPNLVTAVQNQVIADRSLLRRVLRETPHRASMLANHPQLVRQCWKEDLFSTQGNDLPTLASLFRNGLIPEAERVECLETVIRRGISSSPNEIDDATLGDVDFFVVLEQVAVDEGQLSNFDWANTSAVAIVQHLQRAPITVGMARAIYQVFDNVHNPREVRPRLNTFFAGNNEKRNEFLNIEGENAEIGRPQHLPALQ